MEKISIKNKKDKSLLFFKLNCLIRTSSAVVYVSPKPIGLAASTPKYFAPSPLSRVKARALRGVISETIKDSLAEVPLVIPKMNTANTSSMTILATHASGISNLTIDKSFLGFNII